jgi:hypothetical protein
MQKIFKEDINKIITEFKNLNTFEFIANQYGVTRTRISQIISKEMVKGDIALIKEKRSKYKKRLADLKQKKRYKDDKLYREKLIVIAKKRYATLSRNN